MVDEEYRALPEIDRISAIKYIPETSCGPHFGPCSTITLQQQVDPNPSCTNNDKRSKRATQDRTIILFQISVLQTPKNYSGIHSAATSQDTARTLINLGDNYRFSAFL